MADKVQRAKSQLKEQKRQHEHNRSTFLTNKVSFYHAYKMFWRQTRSMNLMTSRHNYWYMLSWQWLIKVILLVLISLFGSVGVFSSLAPNTGKSSMIFMGLMFLTIILGGIYIIAIFIPMLTMTMRRYHDVGLSRYWGMLIYALMGILVLIYVFTGGGTTRAITLALLVITAPGNLIICSLPQGQFVKDITKGR